MRVLLVFPMADNETGMYLKKAFINNGCEVIIVDAKLEPKKLFIRYCEEDPDLIFCSRTKELLREIKLIKADTTNPHKPCIMVFNVDKRDSVKEFGPELLELFNLSDVFYTIALGNCEEYRKLCPNTVVRHLQQGCDPEVHHNRDIITDEDHAKYDCDVMFVGSYQSYAHHGRRELIDYLLHKSNLKIKLFGLSGAKISGPEHNKACRCAKVVLGHNGWPTIAISMSVRVYKVMAAGGFLLEEYCEGAQEWLKSIDTYRTKEECLDKLQYWIKEDYKRDITSECGRRYITENHTYTHRIKQVLEDYNNKIWKK